MNRYESPLLFNIYPKNSLEGALDRVDIGGNISGIESNNVGQAGYAIVIVSSSSFLLTLL